MSSEEQLAMYAQIERQRKIELSPLVDELAASNGLTIDELCEILAKATLWLQGLDVSDKNVADWKEIERGEWTLP
jgi:hypothetical protein